MLAACPLSFSSVAVRAGFRSRRERPSPSAFHLLRAQHCIPLHLSIRSCCFVITSIIIVHTGIGTGTSLSSRKERFSSFSSVVFLHILPSFSRPVSDNRSLISGAAMHVPLAEETVWLSSRMAPPGFCASLSRDRSGSVRCPSL